GIAYYEVLAFRRTQARSRLVFSEEVLSRIASETSRQAASLDALEECMLRLNVAQKQMLRDRYSRGLPVAQIAEQCGKPVSTVTTKLFRIRQLLLDCIRSKLEGVR